MPKPQQFNWLVARIAHMPPVVAAKEDTPLNVPTPPMPTTETGTAVRLKSPLPNCPLKLSPQQSTWPFVSRAHIQPGLGVREATPPSTPVPPMPNTADGPDV